MSEVGSGNCKLRDASRGRRVGEDKGGFMRIVYDFSVWLVIVFFALAFSGCASQQNASSASSNSTAKSYSSEDLQKTGKRTSGEALQAADPAVTTRGGN